MNIFVAGIHGVGKSYLASKVAVDFGFIHTSASTLIREELQNETWTLDKKVSDIDKNQLALANAVKKKNSRNQKLLIDGHFILLNKAGGFEQLDTKVFSWLNLSGVVLIEADPIEIARRIERRDNVSNNFKFLEEFIYAERKQAYKVCEKLNLRIQRLKSPTVEQFRIALYNFKY